MKTIKYLFGVFLLGWTLQSTAYAQSECYADLWAAIFIKNGELGYSTRVSEAARHQTFAQSWEECYAFAIEKAKEYSDFITVTLRYKNKRFQEVAPGFVLWRFNDGLFFDSKGEVTLYTDRYFGKPTQGDAKVFENGDSFQCRSCVVTQMQKYWK